MTNPINDNLIRIYVFVFISRNTRKIPKIHCWITCFPLYHDQRMWHDGDHLLIYNPLGFYLDGIGLMRNYISYLIL